VENPDVVVDCCRAWVSYRLTGCVPWCGASDYFRRSKQAPFKRQRLQNRQREARTLPQHAQAEAEDYEARSCMKAPDR
jgi:hypothetical protein